MIPPVGVEGKSWVVHRLDSQWFSGRGGSWSWTSLVRQRVAEPSPTVPPVVLGTPDPDPRPEAEGSLGGEHKKSMDLFLCVVGLRPFTRSLSLQPTSLRHPFPPLPLPSSPYPSRRRCVDRQLVCHLLLLLPGDVRQLLPLVHSVLWTVSRLDFLRVVGPRRVLLLDPFPELPVIGPLFYMSYIPRPSTDNRNVRCEGPYQTPPVRG